MAEQELRAKITADDSNFQKTTKRSEKRGKNFAKKMVKYGQMIAGALAVKQIGRFVTGTIKATAQVDRMADRLGIGVEALQELNYAAKQYGVSQEAMQDGLKELTMRVDEFAKRGKGPAAEVMKDLGFTREEAKQLKGNTEELFTAVVEQISKVGDTASRQRIADELFGGQGGEQLVKMVSDGTEALKEFRQEAQEMGLVLSSTEMAQMAELDQQMKKATSTAQGWWRQIVVNVVPAMEKMGDVVSGITNPAAGIPKLINQIRGATKSTEDFKKIAEATEEIFAGLSKQTEENTRDVEDSTDAFILGESSIQAHKEQLKALEDQLKNLSPQQQGQIDNILEQRKAINKLLKDTLELQEAQEAPGEIAPDLDMPSAEEMFGGKESFDMTMGGIIDDEGAMQIEKAEDNLKDFSNMVIKSREEMSLAEQTAKRFGQQMLVSTKTGVNSMEEYGKAVANTARDAISAYLAMTVAKSIESAVGTGPLGMILAPVAAGAAATMFNSLVPEFAEGGAVTGPTLAMIGEGPGVNRSNPEYVGTADQIGKMGGGNGYIAEARIDMDELRIAIKEQDRYTQNTL